MPSTANAENHAANAVDGSPQEVQGDQTLIANAPENGVNTVSADADNTNGPASATADSGESAAVIDSPVTAGGNATLVARELLSVTADAETTTGDATADAHNDSNGRPAPRARTGGLIDSDQAIGGDYGQTIVVDNSTVAVAGTETGNADAAADEFSTFGIRNSTIDVEGDYNSTVDNDNTISASASTTTHNATAESESTERTGVGISRDVFDVEGDADLAVTVGTEDDPNTMSASAIVVGDGNAAAFVGATYNYGITATGGVTPDGDVVLDDVESILGGASIAVSGNANITAEVDNVYSSVASTSTGDASATTNTSDRFGIEGAIGSGETIGIDAAVIEVGGDAAILEGTVDNESGTTADAKTGDATAVDSSGLRAGIRANTLDVAGTSIITGSVVNDQAAIASSVTEADGGDGAKASVTAGDDRDEAIDADITGVDADNLHLGGVSTIAGSVALGLTAQADITTGGAESLGELGGDVTGVLNSSHAEAGADLTVDADASVVVESSASNTKGSAAGVTSTAVQAGSVIGLDQSTSEEGEFRVNGYLDVDGDVFVALDSSAKSVDDDSISRARSVGEGSENSSQVKGVVLDAESPIDLNGGASIVGDALAELSAVAESKAGSSTAESLINTGKIVGFTGVNVQQNLDVEADVLLDGSADLSLHANAFTVGGSTEALATSGDFVQGVEVKGSAALVDVSGDAVIDGEADVVLSAEAAGTGDSSADRATADAELIGGLGSNFSSVGGGSGLNVDGNLDADGDVQALLSSVARIKTGSARADSDLTRKAVGLVFGGRQSSGDSATVGKDANLAGRADISLVSVASSTTGDAEASSDAEGKNAAKPGLVQSVDVADLSVNADAVITADTDLFIQSDASTVTGDSAADSTTDEINGLNIENQLTSGGQSTLKADVDATLAASAGTTSGDADAGVQGAEGVRAIESNDIDAAGAFSASGTIDLVGTAYAETVNPDGDNSGSTAEVSFVNEIQAVELDHTDVEANAEIVGVADVDLEASAISVNTNANADTRQRFDEDLEDQLEGVDLDDLLDAEGNISVEGRAELSATAIAKTTHGEADAAAESGGLNGIDYETVQGADVVLDGDAVLDQTASAITTEGLAKATTFQQTQVAGVNQRGGEGLATEASGFVGVDGAAASIGLANAGTIHGNAEASFQADDEVVGAEFSDALKSFGDISVTGNAALDDTALATSGSGSANADVEAFGAEGVEFDADVTSGGDVSLSGSGSAVTRAVASSTGDQSSDQAHAKSSLTEVIGIHQGGITINSDTVPNNADRVSILGTFDGHIVFEIQDDRASEGIEAPSSQQLVLSKRTARPITDEVIADQKLIVSPPFDFPLSSGAANDLSPDIQTSDSVNTFAFLSLQDVENFVADKGKSFIYTRNTDTGEVAMGQPTRIRLNAQKLDNLSPLTSDQIERVFSGALITIKGDFGATGDASALQSAHADISTGDATAEIIADVVVGAHFDDNLIGAGSDGIDVAGDAKVTGDAVVNNDATASSTTGDATANESVDQTTGLIDDLNVGGDADVAGTASVVGSASATTVTGTADADSGTYDSDVTGYDVQGRVDVGGDAALTGGASSSNTSFAAATTGGADATSVQGEVNGILIDRESHFQAHPDIDVAGDAEVIATAASNSFAEAATTTGDATAQADNLATVGFEIGDSADEPALSVAGDSVLRVQATNVGTADASATTNNATAEVNDEGSNDVTGINSDDNTLDLNGDADVNALARSTQTANASTTTGDARAKTAFRDDVVGSDDTSYDIEGNATQFDSRGELTASSGANAVTGDAVAKAGIRSEAIGFENGSVDIAGNATGEFGLTDDGILSYGNSVLTTEAETGTGDASAESTSVRVKGAEGMDLDVAGNVDGPWGARALAVGDFSASAQSVNGETTEAVLEAEARGFDADGESTSGDIDILGNGNVTQIAQMVADAEAMTIGDSTNDGVQASVNLDAIGGDFSETDGDITINGDGNALADGVNQGSAFAYGVHSIAFASSNVNSEGFKLGDNNIEIGGAGDVSGRGFIGDWDQYGDAYLIDDAFSVSAETTTGNAYAAAGGGTGSATFTAIGIGGFGGADGGDAMVTAGPSGGDITGTANAAADLSATTTTGIAVSNSMAELFGIQKVNLQGGLDGESTIDGQAQGIFNTSSSSVNGVAQATSDVTGIGMDGLVSNAMVNGNINAVADISNTVLASTVTGSAIATATGNAVGIQDYTITMEGDGVITANASTNIVAVASTVTTLDDG